MLIYCLNMLLLPEFPCSSQFLTKKCCFGGELMFFCPSLIPLWNKISSASSGVLRRVHTEEVHRLGVYFGLRDNKHKPSHRQSRVFDGQNGVSLIEGRQTNLPHRFCLLSTLHVQKFDHPRTQPQPCISFHSIAPRLHSTSTVLQPDCFLVFCLETDDQNIPSVGHESLKCVQNSFR